MARMTDGPIILMGHAVSGSPDRSVIDDSVDHRYWTDEVLIASAGQPHLIDRDRPVVIDVARWAWSSAGKYGSGVSLDMMGRYLFGLETDGSPATRDSSHGSGSQAYTLNHMWSDIYDWDAGARLTLSGQFSIEDETIAHDIFEDHPVYGPYCLGFPVGLPRFGDIKGGGSPSWGDPGHPSRTEPHGANRRTAIEAESMARALGLTDPPMFFDWIDWGDGEGDDPRYVHVGIDGHDVTTLRYELDDEDPPGAFGQVMNFVLNGSNVRDATLVTFKGQRRVRLQKPGLAEWSGADVLTMTHGPGVEVTNADRDTLFQLDWPCTPSAVPELLATPLSQWLTTAPTLFDNPLPPPSGLLPEYVTTLTRETNISAATATEIGSITSTGQPLLIVLAMRGTTTSAATPITAATLGGVDIMDDVLVNSGTNRPRMIAFRVPSPATGSLAFNITAAAGVSCAAAQVFEEPEGLGTVQASGGLALGGSNDTRGMLTSGNVATADGTVVLGFVFWTRNEVIDFVSSTLDKMANAEGGEIKVSNTSSNHLSLFGVRKVVNNAGGEGTIVSDASSVGGEFWIRYNPPA